MNRTYKSHPLTHPEGALIYYSFWRASPISRREAAMVGLIEDALQELHVIALDLAARSSDFDTLPRKSICNLAQAASYRFWVSYGFKKNKDAHGSARWVRHATYDPDKLPQHVN